MADSLAHEVPFGLESRLTVNAADSSHFGGSKVYGNVPVASTSGCPGACNKDKKCGKKEVELTGSHPVHSAIASARSVLDNALKGVAPAAFPDAAEVLKQLESLRAENAEIRKDLSLLKSSIEKLQSLNLGAAKHAEAKTETPVAAPAPAKEENEDDFDLFGSDEEDDEEKKKLNEERLKAYNEKKAKKPGPIAKSSVILDVKPWDDETDLVEMEAKVRGITMDGLVWGGAKNIPIGYGISKLQIICVVEDAKVSVDDLVDVIQEFDDLVQSVDIHAFNKI